MTGFDSLDLTSHTLDRLWCKGWCMCICWPCVMFKDPVEWQVISPQPPTIQSTSPRMCLVCPITAFRWGRWIVFAVERTVTAVLTVYRSDETALRSPSVRQTFSPSRSLLCLCCCYLFLLLRGSSSSLKLTTLNYTSRLDKLAMTYKQGTPCLCDAEFRSVGSVNGMEKNMYIFFLLYWYKEIFDSRAFSLNCLSLFFFKFSFLFVLLSLSL